MNDSNDRSAGDYSRITMDNKNREDVSNLINEIDQDDSQELHRVCQSTQNDFVLPDTCTVLETNEGSKVYLVGTAHFSKESCKEVQEVRLLFNDEPSLEFFLIQFFINAFFCFITL